MADEELVVRASIDDELSRPLEKIRENVEDVGDEADKTGRKANAAATGWGRFGTAAHKAGQLAKRALAGIAVGTAAAAVGAYKLAKSSITAASDLNESLNAVNVTYGKQAKAVQRLGRQAAGALGLSNTEFNGLAVRFSAFAKTIGGGGKGTVKALDKLTKRASDFASVMNLEVAESAELFQSGLAGETEPLRKYGVDLSAASVTAYAYASGIAKSGEELTEAQKVQARYGSLMEQTQKTHKDFANTSGELANQQRILGARWENAKAKLGAGLLPVMQTAVGFLNREGIPAFLRFSDWFNEDGLPAIQDFIEKARPLAGKTLTAIGDALEVIRDMAKAAAPYAEDLVGAFINAPGWVKKLLVGGAVTGVAAKKLGIIGGGGKGGALGAATSLLGKTKPVPVFVTNPGFGGKPGGGGLGGPGAPGAPSKPGTTPAPSVKPKAPITAMPGGWRGMLPVTPFMLELPADWDGGGKVKSEAEFHKEFQLGPGVLGGVAEMTDRVGEARKGWNDMFTDLYRQTPQSERHVKGLRDGAFDYQKTVTGIPTTWDTELGLDGIPRAKNELTGFDNAKKHATKPATAQIGADTGAAHSAIAVLSSAIRNLSGTVSINLSAAGNMFGDVFREKGGPVKAGRPYIVGERRAEVFVPPTDGKIMPRVQGGAGGGRTITIEPGAVQVQVVNPTSDMDVQEAVEEAIRRILRESEERA